MNVGRLRSYADGDNADASTLSRIIIIREEKE